MRLVYKSQHDANHSNHVTLLTIADSKKQHDLAEKRLVALLHKVKLKIRVTEIVEIVVVHSEQNLRLSHMKKDF